MKKISSLLTVAGVGVAWLGLCCQAHANLINHWKFDEASGSTMAADSAGSLDVTLQGGADFVNDATRGQVLALDGVDDYASNAGEPFTSDMDHTVSVWVNHFDPGVLWQGWISWGSGSGGRYFFGTHNIGYAYAGIGNNLALFDDSDSQPLEDIWQYWTFVRQGTTASLYINGEFAESLTVSDGGQINSAGELRIGRQFDTYECYLHGLMDDMAIWNEVLTADEINNAMNYGAENYQVPEPSSVMLLISVALGALGMLRLQRSGRR